ncbi:MAG: tetratricopeptide repeat protein [Chthonomonadales bacterium]
MNAMTDAIAQTPDPALETALAEANLYRIRGLWSLAEQQCIAVLRKDPNNVHAHSLLGDTFFAQGKYEEAAAWYQMALDLDADSEPDRLKLQKARDLAAKQQAAGSGGAGATAGTGTQKLLGLKPAVWVNAATAVGVLFLVTIGGVLLFKPVPEGRQAPVPASPAPKGIPQGQAPGPPLPPPAARTSAASPKPVMPAEKPHPKRSEASAANTLPGSGDGAASLEKELWAAIASDPWVQPTADVSGVHLDPQMQRVTIELIYRGPQSTPQEARPAAVWAALGAARGAFQTQNPTLQETLDAATILVYALDGQGKPSLMLTAETNRGAIAGLPPEPDLGTALQFGFNSLTWQNPPTGNAAPPSGGYTGQQ